MPMANIASGRFTAIKRHVACAALACAWATLAGAAPSRPPGVPNADPTFPFSNEIEAFARASQSAPAPSDAVLFLGSSSIRLWDIAGSFGRLATINRGFGGATTAHVLHYYKRLLPGAPPRAIVVYVGENDLAAGAEPESVARDVLTLLSRLRKDYARAPIAFLSLKPSPIRWPLRDKMAAVNAKVAAGAARRRVRYLDVGQVLLASDGLPDASLFRPDGLHMNAAGYQRWTRIIDDWLAAQPSAATRRAGA